MCSLEKCLLGFSVYFLIVFFWGGDTQIYRLCIYFEINPFLVALFANIFFYSVGFLFISFMVSFAVQKLLIRSHLFITLGSGSKKILLRFMSESVLPMFSSKSFIVSGHTFRSLIHFEFIFVCGVRRVLVSFFYRWLTSFPRTTC